MADCVEEAIKQECIKGHALCKVEYVADFVEEPERGWQSLRLTCQGTTSVGFRKCVRGIFVKNDLDEEVISSKKPSSKPGLYRQPAVKPPIFEETEVQRLKQLIEERV